MRRALMAGAIATMVLTTAGCGGGVLNSEATEGEEVRWRLVTHQLKGTSRYEGTIPLFVEEVSKATDGKFIIEPHGGGSLFPVTETYDRVSTGTVEAGAIFTGYWSSKNPVFNLASLPADPISGPEEHFERADAVTPVLAEAYAGSGIEYLGAFDFGPSEIFMSNKPVESLDDFRGMHIRSTGVAAQFFELLGASSVSIAGPELYSAMQLGTVDAAEFNDYLVNAEMGLHEVTDYVIDPVLHTGPTSDKDLIVNEEAWDALPESYQQAFLDARDKVREESASAYAQRNEDAVRDWLSQGVEILKLPETDVKAAEQIAYQWLGDYAGTNELTDRYVTEYVEVLREFGYTEQADAIEAARD